MSAVRGRRQAVGATGWRRQTRTCRLWENSVKWSLIKDASRFVNSLLIRPGSWRREKKSDEGLKQKKKRKQNAAPPKNVVKK